MSPFVIRIEIPDIHVHLHAVAESEILAAILQLKETIMASATELTAKLDAVAVQQQKTIGEIQALQGTVTELRQSVADLQAVIAAGGDPPPELVAAIDKVVALAQQVDDAIPDAPPTV